MQERSDVMAESLCNRLIALRRLREAREAANRRPRPRRLTAAERSLILAKTGGKCHVCGGGIVGAWNADHVLAHSAGGGHSSDNYLPAHSTCNSYRWDYLAEEFELTLKLGVWARTQVETATPVGELIERRFAMHDIRRGKRLKRSAGDRGVTQVGA